MNGSPLGDSLNLILSTVGGLYVGAVVLRFLLQAVKADYYNPVSQTIDRITRPVLQPFKALRLRRFPQVNVPALLVALILNTLLTSLLLTMAGYPPLAVGITNVIAWSFMGLVSLVLEIYFWGLLISVIASWIAPHSGNPVLLLIYDLMEPIQSLFRKILPPMGGLDLSPIFIFLGIRVIDIMLVEGVARGIGLPPQFVIGI